MNARSVYSVQVLDFFSSFCSLFLHTYIDLVSITTILNSKVIGIVCPLVFFHHKGKSTRDIRFNTCRQREVTGKVINEALKCFLSSTRKGK